MKGIGLGCLGAPCLFPQWAKPASTCLSNWDSRTLLPPGLGRNKGEGGSSTTHQTKWRCGQLEMDVLFTVWFWDRCGKIRSCSTARKYMWPMKDGLRFLDIFFLPGGCRRWYLRFTTWLLFRTLTFTTPMLKLATLGGQQTCGFSWIWMNLEETNLDISWGHQWIRRPKEVITFTHLHLLSQQKTECLFQLWKWNPYQINGTCNRKPKPSHQREVPDLMQLTELVEEVRWQANEHGTRKENQQAITLENRGSRHGFLSCQCFFWVSCYCFWLGASYFSCGEGVCVLKFIAIQTLFPFLLSLWCGMKYFPQHHFEPRVQWCSDLYQDLRGAQFAPWARVTN